MVGIVTIRDLAYGVGVPRMSEGFDLIEDNIDYRLTYGAASRAVEADQIHLRWLDASKPEDVDHVRRSVQDELRGMLEKMNPAIVAEAIDDALNHRQPRW